MAMARALAHQNKRQAQLRLLRLSVHADGFVRRHRLELVWRRRDDQNGDGFDDVDWHCGRVDADTLRQVSATTTISLFPDVSRAVMVSTLSFRFLATNCFGLFFYRREIARFFFSCTGANGGR